MLGYIYKITNQINQKCYIGQTIQSVQTRWTKHINSIGTEKEYAIHKAIKKYGINNFIFEIIEQCDANLLNEKEIYWINYYNSYENGYNLTRGGQGNRKYNYDLIIQTFLNNPNLSCKQLSEQFHISEATICHILIANEIPHNSFGCGTEYNKKRVKQFDKKTNQFIQEFETQKDAAIYIQNIKKSSASLDTISGHIGEVCKGKFKSAYGFKWAY